MEDGVFGEGPGDGVVEDAGVAVEQAGGGEGEGLLEVDVQDADVAVVSHVGGGAVTGLGLDDFVQHGGVDGGGGDVGGVTAVGPQGADEVGGVLLV